jgi:tripartite-type tricarboxylate transporter receptor subunit TctC
MRFLKATDRLGGADMHRRSFLTLTAATLMRPGIAAAASYPAKPVTILVPFAAGGGGDLLARLAADHARNKRGIPVAVEYRPGAAATIAPSQVARAAPDGTVLGLYSVSPFLTVPHLQKLSYDTTKDFTFISVYAFIPLALYVATESAFKDWAGILRYAKDNPGKLRWGTSGVRGVAHVAVEAAFRKEHVQTTFVPFTGGAEAITAMLGGHIEAVVSADYGPHLAAGRVRLLALTGSEKLEGQPQLPTFKDMQYPLATEAIYGLFGPAKLAADVVAYWENLTREMAATDEYKAVLAVANAGPLYLDSKAFTANVIENYAKLGEAIVELGFKAR